MEALVDHRCQDKLPVEELSSQLPRQATVEELAVNLSHNCQDMATLEELAVHLGHNCRDLATVDELAVNIITIA